MNIKELRKAKRLYEKGKRPIILIKEKTGDAARIDTDDSESLLFLTSVGVLSVAARLPGLGILNLDDNNFYNMRDLTLLKYSYRDLTESYEEKGPANDANHIGIEIEFVSNKTMDEVAGLMVEHKLSKYVQVKDDGSIEDDSGREGIELAICASESKIFSILKKVTKLIKPFGYVNDTCGLHVHLDMRNRNKEDCKLKLEQSEGLLYAIHSNRVDNGYCRPTWKRSLDPYGEPHSSRYDGINARHSSAPTIELRMANGSIDYYDISNWILLLLKIINSEPLPEDTIKLAAIKKELGLGAKFNKYFKDKINKDSKGIRELVSLERIQL